ncbi:hypothetical protein J4402_02530 [Candidatus Pacearchaeota archaeon]|nr:hypothetical protein [Candidatus Pacearchaeota archaeon]
MGRRNILEVIEDILKVLRKEKEMSVKRISEEVESQWETTIKALDFMKKINLVKEREGKKTNKRERLFSLLKDFSRS